MSFLSRKITRERVKVFLARHQSPEYTLDIGAGEGAYASFFPHRVGLDLEKKKGVDVVGDAHDLPFPDGGFDIVLASEVLEHLHTPQKAIDEMYRVLKPGGKIILTTRFIYPLHDSPNDFYRFTKYGLKHLFRDFEIEELMEETDSMGALAVLLQTLALKGTFVGGVITKALLLFKAQIIRRLSWLVRKEYSGGRLGGGVIEQPLMTSGYYLVCRKRP